jgi:hypothetical protein
LPQMPGHPAARIDVAGIAPVKIAERARKAVRIGRDQYDMDVVGHEAIPPDFGLRPLRRRSEQIEVERIIAVFEKRLPPPVSALRDVVWNAGNDDTGKAGDSGAPVW